MSWVQVYGLGVDRLTRYRRVLWAYKGKAMNCPKTKAFHKPRRTLPVICAMCSRECEYAGTLPSTWAGRSQFLHSKKMEELRDRVEREDAKRIDRERTVTAKHMSRKYPFFSGYRFRHFGLARWGAD